MPDRASRRIRPCARPRPSSSRRRVDLEHTLVRAPQAGIVSHLPKVGNRVEAGRPAFAIVTDGAVWVEANFKETDLEWVRPGRPVEVDVDTYPSTAGRGRVESIAQATGAEFSLLPAQNASGNWVKVVQRIPVRIALTARPDDPPLREWHERQRVASTPDRTRASTAGSVARAELRAYRARSRVVTLPPQQSTLLLALRRCSATMLYTIDSTIVNVALPHMQGSLQATQDQVAWIITSYIVVSAIMTPLAGWLGARYRPATRAARSASRVHARLDALRHRDRPRRDRRVPHACRARSAPRSCRCRRSCCCRSSRASSTARVMALWGMGVLVGPIIGPTLGGWLTDEL